MTLREFMKLVDFGTAVSVYRYNHMVFPDDEENNLFDHPISRICIVNENELFIDID